jgi:hypothetical protein
MNKINKNSIKYGFKTLALLAFSLLIIPASVRAYDNGGRNYIYQNGGGTYDGPNISTSQSPEVNNPKPYINSISPSSANKNSGAKTVTITGSGFTPNSVARVNNVNRITTFIDPTHLFIQINSSDTYNKDGFFVTVWNQAPGGGYSNAVYFTLKTVTAPARTNTNSNNSNTSNNSYSNTTEENTDSYSNLASNVIYGSDTFLPSGLMQWVLIAIIILLLIIIVRKLFGAEDNYHASPLKHS